MALERESKEFRVSTRNRLLKEQDFRCYYCNRKLKKGGESLDHVIPVIELDEHNDDNYVVACFVCNKSKGNQIVFTNLYDRIVYPIVDTPYFFHADEIIYNYRDKRRKDGKKL